MRKHLRTNRGQSLVEFSLIALALYFIFGAIIDMGRALFISQTLQDAARVLSRELAVTPLPPEMTFAEALTDTEVRSRVFDRKRLVVDLDALEAAGVSVDDYLSPVVNRALRPLMITDQVTIGGEERTFLRYPGALITDNNPDPSDPFSSGFIVGVPMVVGRDADTGIETIDWVPLAEEIQPGSFLLSSPERGLVALRLNYPYQGSVLSAWRNVGGFNQVVSADDTAVAIVDNDGFTPDGVVFDPGQETGVYAGSFGLGRQFAMADTVRPFRRLLSAQAIFRREIFSEVIP